MKPKEFGEIAGTVLLSVPAILLPISYQIVTDNFLLFRIYIDVHKDKLEHIGYEACMGNDLKEFKLRFGTEIDFGQKNCSTGIEVLKMLTQYVVNNLSNT